METNNELTNVRFNRVFNDVCNSYNNLKLFPTDTVISQFKSEYDFSNMDPDRRLIYTKMYRPLSEDSKDFNFCFHDGQSKEPFFVSSVVQRSYDVSVKPDKVFILAGDALSVLPENERTITRKSSGNLDLISHVSFTNHKNDVIMRGEYSFEFEENTGIVKIYLTYRKICEIDADTRGRVFDNDFEKTEGFTISIRGSVTDSEITKSICTVLSDSKNVDWRDYCSENYVKSPIKIINVSVEPTHRNKIDPKYINWLDTYFKLNTKNIYISRLMF